MDEREETIAAEGFDWLYGEDADGSVLETPPAIGAVTEEGQAPEVPTTQEPFDAPEQHPSASDDTPEQHPSASDEEFVVDPEPFAAYSPSESPQGSFMDFDDFDAPAPERGSGAEPPEMATAEAGEDSMSDFDASFGPATTVPAAGIPFSSVQPAPSLQITTPAPPPPAPPTPPAPADVAETSPMQAVEGEITGQIPSLSSRGDIIAVGTRRLSVRERLTPTPRRVRSATSEPKQTSGKTKAKTGKGTKLAASGLVLVLAAGAAILKVEKLHDMVFGNGAPSEAQVDAAFTPLKGHSYREVPAEVMAQMQQMTEGLMPEEVEHFDVRLLGEERNPAGMVLITSVAPDLTDARRWEQELREGLPQELGKLKLRKLGGVTAAVASLPQPRGATMALFPDPDGLLFFVYGRSDSIAVDVAKQMAKANS